MQDQTFWLRDQALWITPKHACQVACELCNCPREKCIDFPKQVEGSTQRTVFVCSCLAFYSPFKRLCFLCKCFGNDPLQTLSKDFFFLYSYFGLSTQHQCYLNPQEAPFPLLQTLPLKKSQWGEVSIIAQVLILTTQEKVRNQNVLQSSLS